MNQEERWNYLLQLDEKLLVGGAVISEWTTFLVRDTDIAFCSGANLATILVGQAAIEAYLRYAYISSSQGNNEGFYTLIELAPISLNLKSRLHTIRKYRNRWVHVNEPQKDDNLLERPEYYEQELEKMALLTVTVLREIIYLEQFI